MANISPNFVWMLNPDGSYKYVNQTNLDYLGVTQEEIAMQGWQAYMHPDDLERVSQAVSEATQAQKPYRYEHRLRRSDGEYRWVFSQAVPHFLEDGTMYAYIGASVDIHDHRVAKEALEASEAQLQKRVVERTKELSAANDALQNSNKELNRSNANLEEFAHAASHDLKEPIRKIHFFTEQLKRQLDSRLSEGERRSFSRIEKATQRMGNLIDDLLLYSHVSQRPHEKDSVNLTEKVEGVLEDLELDIEEKGAIIRVSNLPVIKGYRRQLQQLFQNLISNALKYSKQDVASVIQITADETHINGQAYNVISVVDNGIGFEQQYAEKIFQMFSRLHGKDEYSGTGVGLSIVKKIAENHDGFIRAESVLGEGSTFKVYLPVE